MKTRKSKTATKSAAKPDALAKKSTGKSAQLSEKELKGVSGGISWSGGVGDAVVKDDKGIG